MLWQGRRESENVEDRRGMDGGGPGGSGGFGGYPGGGVRIPVGRGGLGIGGFVALLVVGWLLGVNPLDLLSGDNSGSTIPVEEQQGQRGAPSDQEGKFVSTVLADTEDAWHKIFASMGRSYRDPTLVLFNGHTTSGCGFASAATGPFYCPSDEKLYIDLAFYRELRDRFHAPGEFAEAYVIAHEVGHHVQKLLETMTKANQLEQSSNQTSANRVSVRIELQADCYAGIWARSAQSEDIVEVGDVDAALRAAAAVGDDNLQRQSQGYVVPDSFTHGTSEQRSRWFKEGYERGTLQACDTFAAQQL